MQPANPWPDIVREHGPAVWQTVYRLVADREDASECYQEVFLEAVRLSRSQQVENWGGLLMTIATRRGIDRLRQRLSQRQKHASSDVATVADRRQQSIDNVTDAELIDRLRTALAALPEHQAEAFWLSIMEQQTYEAIAEHLSLTVDHVGVLLHRAREVTPVVGSTASRREVEAMSTNHQPHNDLLERAAEAMRSQPVPPPPADESVLTRIDEAERPRTPVSLWERIRHMPRSLRYSLVTSVALIVFLFVLATGRGSLALADVAEAVQEYSIVRYQEQADEINGPTMQRVVTLDMSLDHLRMEMTHGDQTVINIMDLENGVLLGLMPSESMAMRMPIVGTHKTAESFLDVIRELQENSETVRTEENLDGKPAIVFRLTTGEETRDDMEGYEGVPVGGPYRTTIWVDPETSLPLMIESFYKGPDRDRYSIDSDFEWDPEVADDVFSTEPPAGYVLQEMPPTPPTEQE